MEKRRKRPDRKWQAGLALALLLLLYGCTKKEELLLLSEETAVEEDMSAFSRDAGGQMSAAGGAGNVSEKESRLISDSGDRGTGTPAGKEEVLTTQPGVIYVHVCGAVEKPGVYELETGSRVYEAVEQAGGFAEDAERNYVNQAQILDDGVKLVIPTQEEAAFAEERREVSASGLAHSGAEGENSIAGSAPQNFMEKEIGIVGGTSSGGQDGDAGASTDGRININTAPEAELCKIPGVGATRAAAIAAYRESHGAFEKPEDIMKVNGIKEGMYEKIKDSISVN